MYQKHQFYYLVNINVKIYNEDLKNGIRNIGEVSLLDIILSERVTKLHRHFVWSNEITVKLNFYMGDEYYQNDTCSFGFVLSEPLFAPAKRQLPMPLFLLSILFTFFNKFIIIFQHSA